MGRATIQMIAESAGVSRGTVDRVLHNRAHVKPEIKERVMQTARTLGYYSEPHLNPIKRIVILLPGNAWFNDDLKQEWMRGIEDARSIIQPFGFKTELIECETDLPYEVCEKIDKLLAQGLGGLAISAKDAPMIEQAIRKAVQKGVPVVTYTSDIPHSDRICFIGQDLYRSGRIAADLIGKYMRKPEGEILVVAGNLEFDAHKKRVKGFIDRCTQYGVDAGRIHVVESFNEYLVTYEKVSEELSRRQELEAVYMANESVAACAEAISRSGRTDRIMVVGNDLSNVTKKLLREQRIDFIIEQNIYQQGYQSVLLLEQLILNPEADIETLCFTESSVINAENIE